MTFFTFFLFSFFFFLFLVFLQVGATKIYGFWQLSTKTLDDLVDEIKVNGIEPRGDYDPNSTHSATTLKFQDYWNSEAHFRPKGESFVVELPTDDVKSDDVKSTIGTPDVALVAFIVTVFTLIGYPAILYFSDDPTSQRVIAYMGIPLLLARATAIGACLITALLFFTMSRTALTAFRVAKCNRQPICGFFLCCGCEFY